MFADSVRSYPAQPMMASPPPRDAACAARPRLIQLRDALSAAAKVQPRRKRSGEPPVFFFDRARQEELEAARPTQAKPEAHPAAELIAREIAALCESVEVRRVARAIPGLVTALRVAPRPDGAKVLADLIATPDDETLLVLHPALRLGYRIYVRGVTDVNQFHVMMLAALAGEIADGTIPAPVMPARFATICGDADPVVPAGVPMVVELPFQFLRPSAVRPDGTVPTGFASCDHWLWGWESLAAAPSLDGERVVVLGEPAYRLTWEVERRFPAMAAEAELIQVLSPFQVAERLGCLAGRPVPVRVEVERGTMLAEAA